VATLYSTLAAAAEPTYAERLGWGPKARVIMFHCDDAGMSHASNLGAIESLEQGVVTSVSIMMPCPWVPEIVAYVKQHPQTDAGLHLTSIPNGPLYRWGRWRVSPPSPVWCDPDGYLWHPVPETARPRYPRRSRGAKSAPKSRRPNPWACTPRTLTRTWAL